jgi:mannose-6-phosphate isomerase-like protein (cupin superfamily)
MADYTKLNIKHELDNAAEEHGIEGFEARFARKALGLEQFGFSYQKFPSNWRQPFGHVHREQEEVYVVIGGSGRAKVGDDIVELQQWDALRVPAGTTRQFESGDGGLEYIAVGGNPTGDADTITNWWVD